MHSAHPIAKITCPTSAGYYPRHRLYRLLDKARKAPVLWITGPPGCGKTALVSSYIESRRLPCIWYKVDEADADLSTFFYYLGLAAGKAAPRKRKQLPLLTPERMPGLSVFAQRYFEGLSSLLPVPSLLVLDDCHRMREDSAFFETLREGISRLAPGIGAVLVSRNDPHPSFARERANRHMEVLGWKDLRLTLSECIEIVRLRSRKGQSHEAIRRLYEAADGWAAGLALMLAGTRPRNGEPPRLTARPAKEVFDYFGNEVFERTGRAEKEFLVMTAILPSMTARAAQSLTGLRRAPQLLSDLSARNYFLEMHSHPEPVYQYHPLYRDFLLSRVRDVLGEKGARDLKRRAAAILEEAGRAEDAARLYCEMGALESITRLIRRHAPSLLAQGRNKVLDEWLRHLPEKTVQNDPWLLLWMGACRMPFGPEVSRWHLERSFDLFWKGENPAGTFLSWSLIMDNLCMFLNDFNAMDEWVTVFSGVMERYPSFPSPEIEARVVASLLGGLYMRRVDHPDIEAWANRALSVVRQCRDIPVRLQGWLYLFLYFIWIGDFPKARVIVESTRSLLSSASSHPQIKILFHLFVARYHCGVAQFDRSLRSVDKGLEIARSSGMHILDFFFISEGVCASLGKRDLDSASRYLQKMSLDLGASQRLNHAYFHHLSSWRAALQGDIPLALSFEDRANELVTQCGAPCGMALGQIYSARLRNELGDVDAADKHLETASVIAKGMRSPILDYQYRLVEADIAFLRGDEPSGIAALKKALGIGRNHGYFHYDNWLPSFMIRICVRALASGIEVPYVQELIRKRKLVSASPPLELETWPWPIKIRTLGRFEIFLDGEPLAFSRKVQKRPLTLLKALISFGGQDVREDQLADAVWPEAEADMAYQSMSVALRRLRQLIGSEEAVQRREGLFSLDPRFCWVDAFAFESLLAESPSPGGKGGMPNAGAGMAEKSLALYRGPFLPGNADLPWTVSMRERLRSKYLRTVGRLGTHWRMAGEWEKALDCYQRGLEVDNLAEEFYQSLMNCYLVQGRRSEALAVYDRLKKTFSSLGVEPSPKTRALLNSVLSN